MTKKQRAALRVARTLLKQVASNLAEAPARAKAHALKDPNPMFGTYAQEAGWLKGSCEGAAREVRAVDALLAEAFPSTALKEVA